MSSRLTTFLTFRHWIEQIKLFKINHVQLQVCYICCKIPPYLVCVCVLGIGTPKRKCASIQATLTHRHLSHNSCGNTSFFFVFLDISLLYIMPRYSEHVRYVQRDSLQSPALSRSPTLPFNTVHTCKFQVHTNTHSSNTWAFIFFFGKL